MYEAKVSLVHLFTKCTFTSADLRVKFKFDVTFSFYCLFVFFAAS
jgi:hypothetical protein